MPVNTKRKEKKGKLFFIFLLAISGILIIFLLAYQYKGREITIFLFQKLVVDRELEKLLSKSDFHQDDELIKTGLHQFYEKAKENTYTDEELIEVSSTINVIMKDNVITQEEKENLKEIIKKYSEERKNN